MCEPFGNLESVDVRQLYIEENEVRKVRLRLFDAAEPVSASATTTNPWRSSS